MPANSAYHTPAYDTAIIVVLILPLDIAGGQAAAHAGRQTLMVRDLNHVENILLTRRSGPLGVSSFISERARKEKGVQPVREPDEGEMLGVDSEEEGWETEGPEQGADEQLQREAEEARSTSMLAASQSSRIDKQAGVVMNKVGRGTGSLEREGDQTRGLSQAVRRGLRGNSARGKVKKFKKT
jgi:hypothetical protein